jgi:chromosome segregation ATPase
MGKANRLKRISRLENHEAEKPYSSLEKDNDDKISMSIKDDTISKLRELNQVLIAETERLKEEREAGKKMEDSWKEVERDLRNNITVLQQELNDAVKQHSDSVQQHSTVTENSLNEQNEMLRKEVDDARCLLEMQNQRVEDFLVENARLQKQLEEKEEQRTEFESFRAELSKKYEDLEEKHLELLKENGEREKMILSLQRDNTSLGNEKSLFLQNLHEETKRSQEISEKCLKSDQRVLYLESQSLELQRELASAKSAYDKVALQLNMIKEDLNKLSNDSHQIKEEKEALDQKLMLQFSINKELEEELVSAKSSFEELKESASKGEQQIDVVVEKDSQIFYIQCKFCAMVIQFAYLQYQLSTIAKEKRFVEKKNTEIERRKVVSDEEQVHLKGKIEELERALDLGSKDFESCRAMAMEKEYQLSDLRHQLSDIVEVKKCLQEENNSLRTEVNKCKVLSQQILQLSDKMRELDLDLV